MQQDETIYTIADKAKVSASTVSRVINNYPYVKKATRAKVLKLLEQCNYVPNETARSLVNQSTKMVAILISDVRTTHHTDGVYFIEQEFAKYGYSCLIYNTGTDAREMSGYIQLMSQRKVEGAIFMGSVYQNEEVRKAIETYLPSTPIVLCYGFLEGSNIFGIISDEAIGICNCMKLLAGKGKKHVAFIANHITPSNLSKQAGYEQGLSMYFPDAKPIIDIAGDEPQDIYDATQAVMRKQPETDAIVYSEDFLALCGLQGLNDLSKSVPKDVAVVGVNNSKYAKISIPALTSLDIMIYDTSLTAVRNLISIFKGEHVNKKMLICSEIVQRKST
jgi:LacI family transcriptional regulator